VHFDSLHADHTPIGLGDSVSITELVAQSFERQLRITQRRFDRSKIARSRRPDREHGHCLRPVERRRHFSTRADGQKTVGASVLTCFTAAPAACDADAASPN
jgi:hypothetical protein